VLDDDSVTLERRNPVEFCHRVAGAVFETLSDEGYDAVETAVMDASEQADILASAARDSKKPLVDHNDCRFRSGLPV